MMKKLLNMKLLIFFLFIICVLNFIHCHTKPTSSDNEPPIVIDEIFHLEYSFGYGFLPDSGLSFYYDTIHSGKWSSGSSVQYSFYDSGYGFSINDIKNIPGRSNGILVLNEFEIYGRSQMYGYFASNGSGSYSIGNLQSHTGYYYAWQIDDTIREVLPNNNVFYYYSLQDSLLLAVGSRLKDYDSVLINSNNYLEKETFYHINRNQITVPDSVTLVKIYNRIRHVKAQYVPVIIVSYVNVVRAYADSVSMVNPSSVPFAGWDDVTDIYFGCINRGL